MNEVGEERWGVHTHVPVLIGRRVQLRPLTPEDDHILYPWVVNAHEAYCWRGRRNPLIP